MDDIWSVDTALCPYCETDSVIGDASGYPVTEEFLRKMHIHWFEDIKEQGKNNRSEMRSRMDAVWYAIEELRETTINISEQPYSARYAETHNLMGLAMAKMYGGSLGVWIPEPLEVALNDQGEVVCRFGEAGKNTSHKERFETSAGVFVSNNRGEFGGELITPKSVISGNFAEVFECGQKTYAIDSNDHMTIGHIKIYGFSEKLEPIEIYASKKYWLDGKSEKLSYRARFVKGDKAYILASGRIDYKGKNYEPKSYLLEIKNFQLEKKTEIDYSFGRVKNMIIHNNQMILGLDKVVGIVELGTKAIKAYTPISIKAENDLKESMGDLAPM